MDSSKDWISSEERNVRWIHRNNTLILQERVLIHKGDDKGCYTSWYEWKDVTVAEEIENGK